MQRMKRITLALAAAIISAGVLPGLASALELELGATTSPLVAPTCPTGVAQTACKIVLTEVTALESNRDGVAYPTTVKKAGLLVAFSIGVSQLSTSASTAQQDIAYLDSTHGGPPQVEVTVLRPIGPHANWRWAVAAQSLPFQLLPYLGDIPQFPLIQPLPVVPGEVVAITVPTWAPVLSIDLTQSAFAYRQSRSSSCSLTSSADLAQLTIGDQAGYGCSYRGTRLEYSATEITSPTPNR